jgi:hypothetical protein
MVALPMSFAMLITPISSTMNMLAWVCTATHTMSCSTFSLWVSGGLKAAAAHGQDALQPQAALAVAIPTTQKLGLLWNHPQDSSVPTVHSSCCRRAQGLGLV